MSSEPPQPEFFLDRALGKGFAQTLEDDGWIIHRIGDLYPHDAQLIPDEEWIAEASRRGWAMLTKDQHIRYRADELGSLEGRIFCLAHGNMTVAESADCFRAAKTRIHREAQSGPVPSFWKVYVDGRIRRSWP